MIEDHWCWVKVSLCNTTVCPCMMYGIEALPLTKKQEQYTHWKWQRWEWSGSCGVTQVSSLFICYYF